MRGIKFWTWLWLLIWLVGSYQRVEARDYWHAGEIRLIDGTVLKGELHYSLPKESVLIRYGNLIKAFGARQVKEFSFFDRRSKTVRTFQRLPFRRQKTYLSESFFEVLRPGLLTLLNREVQIDYRQIYNGKLAYSPYTEKNAIQVVDEFYVVEENGEVKRFRGKPHEWKKLLGRKASIVSSFIKQNRLQMDRRSDIFKAFHYLENLEQSEFQEQL